MYFLNIFYILGHRRFPGKLKTCSHQVQIVIIALLFPIFSVWITFRIIPFAERERGDEIKSAESYRPELESQLFHLI